MARRRATLGAGSPENLADPANTVLSTVVAREIRIKQAFGKLDLSDKFGKVLAREPLVDLFMTAGHAQAFPRLPMHHRAPFDPMLVAQAQFEDLYLETKEPVIAEYDILLWQVAPRRRYARRRPLEDRAMVEPAREVLDARYHPPLTAPATTGLRRPPAPDHAGQLWLNMCCETTNPTSP